MDKNYIPTCFDIIVVWLCSMIYIGSFFLIMRRIGLNKISIRVKVRAIGKIGIEKRLMYRLTLPLSSG